MILVVGENLIDLVVTAGGPIRAEPGGGPFNTARAIARLGLPCSFLGRLSDDRFGDLLAGRLRDDGVGVAVPRRLPVPATLALAEVEDGQASYRFYLEGTAAFALESGDVRLALELRPEAVHVGSLGLVVEPMASAIVELVEALPAGTLVMVDPNCRPAAIRDLRSYRGRLDRLLARADVVKASVDDLAFLEPGDAADVVARRLLDAGPTAVLLTHGAAPARAFARTGEVEVDVPVAQVVDTIGAGDVFGGSFLAWWSRHGLARREAADLHVLREGLAIAARAAAFTCEHRGAEPPRLADLPGFETPPRRRSR